MYIRVISLIQVVFNHVLAENLAVDWNSTISNETLTNYNIGVSMGIINPEKYSLKSFEKDEPLFKHTYKKFASSADIEFDRSKDTAIEGPYPAENSCQAAANPGLSDGEPDPEECPNIVLPQKFLEAVTAAVKGVALKRAKASKDIAISEAIASINAAAVDAIEDLRAEVTRQAAGLEALRKENQSHREDQAGLRGEPGPQMPQKEGHNQPQPETENQLLTMVKQELAAFQQQQQQQQQQFQQRMQQQLSVLEGIVLRPSLAGSESTQELSGDE
ncbi:hypothetical protein PYW07_015782 [Mythimna separata]|uniref:Uncharacterized protein n=1 Tax=Mythimna separata TaxID=271217 RepID=A0AAD8DUR0_MYTSE|nr:hypothetical protein PYW07_015782 [Mythimna separata]